MDANKTKDMVILKDVPSNIVQEAYIVLKPNIKQRIKEVKETQKNTMPGYIIKEAENVISNYLSTIEKNKTIRNIEVEKIRKKYINLKKLCLGLGLLFFLNLLMQITR